MTDYRFLVFFCFTAAWCVSSAQRTAFSCPPRFWTSNPSRSRCRLSLTAPGPEPAHVTIAWSGGSENVTLTPGNTAVRVLDTSFSTDNGVEAKGVVVTEAANAPVVATLHHTDEIWSPTIYTDSTQLQTLPPPSPGEYTYYLAAFSNPQYRCSGEYYSRFYTIAAPDDNTHVVVYNRSSILVDVSLFQFMTYTYVVVDVDFDQTGLRVVTDKPVAVLSGNLCDFTDGIGSTTLTAVPPVSEEATSFMVPHLGNEYTTGYNVKVIATEDDTRVTVDGEEFVVWEGRHIEVECRSDTCNMTSVACSAPCVPYVRARALNNLAGAGMADVIPTHAFYTAATFATPGDADFQHFISVVAQGSGPYDDITLDGEELGDATWTEYAGFAATWLAVANGTHTVAASEAGGRTLAVYVYGSSGNEGGGYSFSARDGSDYPEPGTTVEPPPTDTTESTVPTDPSTEPTVPTDPPTDPPTDATTTAEPTTTTDSGERAIPGYRIVVNGTAQTPDGSDIGGLCAARHSSDMYDANRDMAAAVNALIGQTLCLTSPDLQITSQFSQMTFNDDKALPELQYELSPAPRHTPAALAACAADITAHVADHANWNTPILPGDPPSCPGLVFVPEEFSPRGNSWRCPGQEDENSKADTTNQLLYTHKVYDIVETADGSALDGVCTGEYSAEWARQLTDMMGAINDSIQDGLCENDPIQAVSEGGSFASLGNEAVVIGEFFYRLSPDASFEAAQQCLDAVLEFTLDRENWGNPFIPQAPGCPRLLDTGDSLTLDQELWQCL